MSSNRLSHDDDHLDFCKLEQELKKAVINEERYWLENDAKIRAVEQRVPTYDDFREMVLAAHLKPLEKDDKMNNVNFTQVWNQPARNLSKLELHQNITQIGDIAKTELVVPKSGQEFVQHWKRYCKTIEEKKGFLLSIDSVKLYNIFKVEIAGGLLGEFLDCFQNFEAHEVMPIINCLEVFSKSQRFALSKTFLSPKEKEQCVLLLNKLKEFKMTIDEIGLDKIKMLENMYV